MQIKKIGVIVGSLRKNSYSRAIAKAICEQMPESIATETVEIGDLPLYNQDYDDQANVPETYQAFREHIKRLDGFLFVTPEYNRSFPAVIKNALDVASRPYGYNLWDAKPGAIISVSPGKLSAFGANHHLRQVMVCLNVYMMQQPEAYIGNVASMLDQDGHVKEPAAREFLAGIATAFAHWVRVVSKPGEKLQ